MPSKIEIIIGRVFVKLDIFDLILLFLLLKLRYAIKTFLPMDVNQKTKTNLLLNSLGFSEKYKTKIIPSNS